ncbi:SRPBCC family protein [Lewinella sp. 4G2]|uniref:SRPBCC family protein n=1 Tax=Lewinella sp. 4G2 TaxID=1803372 RepID=UPI0007B4B39B|nr:SRPBCC family protein [Lewinella sp. 4G2]OAV44574.1 cell division protein [Lewinella sp. 4G2]
MATIFLETVLETDIETAFDAARSIDLHLESASQTNERAIAGRTSGLIELGDRTRWRARHFGIYQELEIEITAMDRPYYFVDEMVDGAFKSMKHTHTFTVVKPNQTRMTDRFEFTAPLGLLGRFAEWLFLEAYMTRFLKTRNEILANHFRVQQSA